MPERSRKDCRKSADFDSAAWTGDKEATLRKRSGEVYATVRS